MENTNNSSQDVPASIAIKNLQDKISDAINTCGLPASIIELVFKDFYNEISILSKQIYLKEKQEYENMLKESVD